MNGISLEKRIANGDLLAEDAAEAIKRANEYFIAATSDTLRCVDGRSVERYDDQNPKSFSKPLGPQVHGGAVTYAVIDRIIEGVEPNAKLTDDIQKLGEVNPTIVGDHIDDHAHHPRTGCGAVDNEEAVTDILADKANANAIKNVIAGLYDDAGLGFDGDRFDELQEQYQKLAVIKNSYFDGLSRVPEVIEQINPNGIEKLVGTHNEVFVMLNFVPNTTFHRDHYAASTSGEIQGFNLDVWAISERYGNDTPIVLASAIATLMTLTDGSVILAKRTPQPERQAADLQAA